MPFLERKELIIYTSSKKNLKVVCLVCVLAAFVLLGILLYEYNRTRDYEKTQGTITNVQTKNDTGNERNEQSYRIITFSYIVNGTEYMGVSRVSVPFIRKGKKIVVWYDPINPGNIRNRYLIHCIVCILLIDLIFIVFCIKGCVEYL